MRNTTKQFQTRVTNNKVFQNTRRIPIQKWEVNDSLDITHLELKAREEK